MSKNQNSVTPIDRNRKNKKFHPNDLRNISPQTQAQHELFQAYYSGFPVIANIGAAGTGKTFTSIYLGLQEVLEQNQYNRLILIRSAVATRDVGFLPGTLEEKMEVYEEPFRVICDDLIKTFKSNNYDNLKKTGNIEFMSSSYLRGLTFDNAIIIVDEATNMRFNELNTIMTRVGEHSKIVFCGDYEQDDLILSKRDKSGFHDFMNILNQMNDAAVVNYHTEDIVRSGLVRDYLIAKSELKY